MEDIKAAYGNPIIRNKFTTDPTALAYEDVAYLYTGHDEAPIDVDKYVMNDWLCYASNDLVHWQECPTPLKATDFHWSKGDAYASKVVYNNNKFYWYAAVTHGFLPGKAIGVAVSDSPIGPFRDARGSALITHEMIPHKEIEKANLDPTVLIDDDGQSYIFWGNTHCYYAKMKDSITELDGPIQVVDLPGFAEGAHIHKQNGIYYLSYGYEFPEKVAYAMSNKINGPWEFKGILNDYVYNCETNRPAILEFRGKSYFFYHNGALKTGGSHRRSVCLDYLYYNADGTIEKIVMTKEGVVAA